MFIYSCTENIKTFLKQKKQAHKEDSRIVNINQAVVDFSWQVAIKHGLAADPRYWQEIA